MSDLSIEAFLQHGLYLRNWSKRTAVTYRQALKAFPATHTKATLDEWILAMRRRGLTPGGINLRIRSANSYLTWRREEGAEAVPAKMKLLKAPHRHIQTLSPADVKALLAFKPTGHAGRRRTW